MTTIFVTVPPLALGGGKVGPKVAARTSPGGWHCRRAQQREGHSHGGGSQWIG
jgi:hypothetical protein